MGEAVDAAAESGDELQADVHDLHKLGYAQLLLRDIGGFASFAISFSIISIVTGAAGLYGYGLKMSGAYGLIVGWPLCCIFALAMSASMAEIASSIPTAGAMYHWSTFIGGRGWGWFTGWLNVIGQYAIFAGIDYSMAQFIAPLMWMPPTWANLLGVTAGLMVTHGLFCHFGIRLCARLNDVSAWYHIVLVAVVVGGVLLGAHAPWSQLFSTAADPVALGLPQAPSYGWMFALGLLPGMWIFTGYDASAHISEETHLPRVNSPWGIYMAVAVSGIAGWLLLVAITLGIHDMAGALKSDNAMLFSFQESFGGRGGYALSWLVAGAMWFCGLASLVCGGRTIFAFSRDRGMPGWQLWNRISTRWRTPVWATWQHVLVSLLLVTYLTWSLPDISAIVATAAIALYLCYGLPVALRLLARLQGRWPESFDGPWSLGAFSTPVNLLAVFWVFVICAVFVAPPNAVVGRIFAGLMVALLLLWVVRERKHFVGPRRLGTEEELYEMEHEVEGVAHAG